jgi:hypothetical protein
MIDPQPADGLSAWKKQVRSRASRVNQDLNVLVENDFETDAPAAAITFATGAVTYDTGLSGGVARLRTGAGPSAIAGVYNAGGAALVGNPTAESWYAHARCWIKNTPTGTTGFAVIGVQDTGGIGQYVALGLAATYSATYLVLLMDLGGGLVTPAVSSVAADLTGFHDYGIGRDAVNDKFYALVDDTPILELDGPFANLTALPSNFYSSIQATLLGQDVQMWVDNIAVVAKGV